MGLSLHLCFDELKYAHPSYRAQRSVLTVHCRHGIDIHNFRQYPAYAQHHTEWRSAHGMTGCRGALAWARDRGWGEIGQEGGEARRQGLAEGQQLPAQLGQYLSRHHV